MEKRIIAWAVGIVLVGAFIFNTDLTGNVTKDQDPVISIFNNIIQAGYTLELTARNLPSTTNEFYILDADLDYTGHRFFSRSSRCEKVGMSYECTLQYRIPISTLPEGNYYVQVKDRKGNLVGNKAMFTVVA